MFLECSGFWFRLGVATAGGLGSLGGVSRLPQSPPDILWIVTTQWRAQALGSAGDINACTPHLDAMAAVGGNFTEAVTPHPFGPFARAALLTGVPSPANGVADYWDALPDDARTVAHDLNDRGYTTTFIGKWGVGRRDRSAPLVGEAAAMTPVPTEARGGFANWIGFEGGFQLNDPWLQGNGRTSPERVKGYQSDVLVDEALIAWNRDPARPNFMLLSLEAPHPPYGAAVPPGIRVRNPEELELYANVPRGGEIEARARRELAGYYAHIEATDRALGRLIDGVADSGRATVVVFTSVHGDMHGAYGMFRKGWPHEESVRVPFIVSGWSARPGAWRSAEAVSLTDLRSMTLAWADGDEWVCRRDHAEISMPCVVALPDQCDRVWRGSRAPGGRKELFQADGSPWALKED